MRLVIGYRVQVTGTGNWLLVQVISDQNPREASLGEMSIPGVLITCNHYQ